MVLQRSGYDVCVQLLTLLADHCTIELPGQELPSLPKIGAKGTKLNARTILARIRGGQTTEQYTKGGVVFH